MGLSRILILLLVILSLFVKNWELLGINFYLYATVILAIYLLLMAVGENPPDDIYQFRIQHEGVLLTLFAGFPVLEYLVGIPPRIPDAVLLMVAIVATYHVFSHVLWVSKIDLRLVFLATLGMGIVSVVLLLLQVYVSMAFDITQHLSTLGIVESTLDTRNGYLETVARQGRGIATSVGRFNTPMFLVLFFVLVETWNQRGRVRWLYVSILVLLTVGFVTNSAQSFQLSVFGTLLIWGTVQFVQSSRISRTVKVRVGLLAVLCSLTGMLVLGLFAMSYLSNVPPSSIAARLYLWSAALDAFSTRPILGIGIGNFEPLFETLSPVIGNFPWNMEPREPHSLLFGLLAEAGLLGTTFYLGFVGIALKRAYRNLSNPQSSSTDTVLFLAFVGQLIMSMFGNLMTALSIYLLVAMVGYRNNVLRETSPVQEAAVNADHEFRNLQRSDEQFWEGGSP